MARTREQMLQMYGGLYRDLIKKAGDNACAYCGNIADESDHVPPLSWVYALGYEWFDRERINFILVPSCGECNNHLGHKRLFTLKERTLHLIDLYERKYKRIRQGEAWTDDEIYGLTGRLRAEIKDWALLQFSIDRRMRVLEENAELLTRQTIERPPLKPPSSVDVRNQKILDALLEENKKKKKRNRLSQKEIGEMFGVSQFIVGQVWRAYRSEAQPEASEAPQAV